MVIESCIVALARNGLYVTTFCQKLQIFSLRNRILKNLSHTSHPYVDGVHIHLVFLFIIHSQSVIFKMFFLRGEICTKSTKNLDRNIQVF